MARASGPKGGASAWSAAGQYRPSRCSGRLTSRLA
ncbi:Uncharacterised protein [Bordetella pertussis]|nr:Uncharacterised protein [Bordetella pertussis]CFP65236.1 Uncharacterised protein [Bordetella pertussis]